MFMFIFGRLFRFFGWKLQGGIPKEVGHCVLIGAPHTSNMDFMTCMGGFALLKIPLRLVIKKEVMFFPLNILMKRVGVLAIDRTPKEPGGKEISIVEGIINAIKETKEEQVVIAIAPEGTRKFVKKWKSGFYHVAVGAGVPLALGFVDYKKKIAGIDRIFYPTGDYKKDLKEIFEFYRHLNAYNSDQFNTDIEI